jgi:PAS domain S-box-containing protein
MPDQVEDRPHVPPGADAPPLLGRLLDAVPAIVSYITPDRRFALLSANHRELLGGPAEQFVGREVRAALGDEEYARLARPLRDALAGAARQYEHHWAPRSEDPRLLSVELTPHRIADGQIAGVFACARDVTAARRAEKALAESERTHRTMLTTISDAVFLTDDAGALTYVCPNVQAIFGHGEQAVRRMGHIRHLLGEELFDLAELIERGELANIERSVVDRAGGAHDLLINVKRVAIAGGTVLYTCRDVTEHKRAQRQLQADQQALREKNLALRQVLATIQQEKAEVAQRLRQNIEQSVAPLVSALRNEVPLSARRYVDLLSEALDDVLEPVSDRLQDRCAHLTPAELRVCRLIRRGLSSKEIARIESVSTATVHKHRENIRRKLELTGRSVNLASYLDSLPLDGALATGGVAAGLRERSDIT